jgi:hypothetical protein
MQEYRLLNATVLYNSSTKVNENFSAWHVSLVA